MRFESVLRSTKRELARVLGALLLALLAGPAAASEYAGATSHGRPNFDAMECGNGAFFDPRNGGECWSCGDAERSSLVYRYRRYDDQRAMWARMSAAG